VKWNLLTGERMATFPKIRPDKGKGKAHASDMQGHMDEVWCLAMSSEAQYLASGGKDRRVCIWDVAKGEWVKTFFDHRDSVSVRNLLVALKSCTSPFASRYHFEKEASSSTLHPTIVLSSSLISGSWVTWKRCLGTRIAF